MAGVPVELIEKLAKNAINSKSLLTVTASFVSGLPGGLIGLLGGSSADVIQYYANFLNLAQKLMYLYGYQDISDLDSSQEDIMIVVMGVASGVEVANAFLKKALPGATKKAFDKILLKQVSRRTVSVLGKKYATRVGEEQVAKIAGKAIPFVGGILSGAISATTFKPMAKKLNTYLKEFYTYVPENNSEKDIIDIEY